MKGDMFVQPRSGELAFLLLLLLLLFLFLSFWGGGDIKIMSHRYIFFFFTTRAYTIPDWHCIFET